MSDHSMRNTESVLHTLTMHMPTPVWDWDWSNAGRAYFDLGGWWIWPHGRNYSRLTADDLGYGVRGVPVDVVCTAEGITSSLVWIIKWIRATVRLKTDTGRNIILTQEGTSYWHRETSDLCPDPRPCWYSTRVHAYCVDIRPSDNKMRRVEVVVMQANRRTARPQNPSETSAIIRDGIERW